MPAYELWDPAWIRAWAVEMTDWSGWEDAGIPPPVFLFLVTASLWLRGVLDGGQQSVVREQVWRAFVTGFILFALLLVFGAWDSRGLPQRTSSFLWLFFASGMIALALAGLRRGMGPGVVEDDAPSSIRPGFDRYWLGSVLTVIGGILGLALVISVLVAPEILRDLFGAVWLVMRQLLLYAWIAISLLLYPLAYLLARLFSPLVDALSDFAQNIRLELGLERLSGEQLRAEEMLGGEPGVLERLPDALRWVALAVLVLLVGWIFARALRRLLSSSLNNLGIEETRETIFSVDLLQAQLSDLMRDWMRRWRKDDTVTSPFLLLDGEVSSRRIIRRVYQSLLALAREQGRPRPRAQTPSEYQDVLASAWPGQAASLKQITEAYVQARYAAEPPSLSEAEHVRRAWEGINQTVLIYENEQAEGERGGA
jgi:hypothetical protein